MIAFERTAHATERRAGDETFAFRGVKNVPLNFQLGEWRLLSIAHRLAVYECTNRAAPPLATLPSLGEADGYLLTSLPAPIDLPHGGGSWIKRVLRHYPRHFVDLTTGYDAYLEKFSGKTRSTLKRKLRKFQELSGGAIDWKEYRTPDELRIFMPLARTLSAKTYQERLLRAGLPDSARFADETMARAARDEVRAYILFLDAKPVSYLFLPIDDTRVIYAHLGYDPAVSEHSPGTVLQLLALERLFAERRFSVFDFTEGGGGHKELFATHTEQCVDMLILKRTLSTLTLSSVHATFVRTEAALAKLVETLGLKKRLKQLLRRAASSGD